MAESGKIRAILFDDNKLLRTSMKEIINSSNVVELIECFEDCSNLITHIESYSPDVVIMDIEMPEINGIDAVKLIRSRYATLPILMQTIFDDNDNIYNAIAAGAGGYILKNYNQEAIIQAIVDVYHGGAPLSPGVARKVLQFLQSETIEKTDFKLSIREKEVLHYLVQGLPHKQIAAKLNITYDTVRSHMKKIYEKLHVSSMTEAVAKAMKYKMY